MSRIVHFEIPSDKPETSRKFYETVFGWTLTKWEGPTEYWLVTTGPESEIGINGGLGGAADSLHGTVNTVGVDNIDETLRLIQKNGGQVIMEKSEIQGMGWVAYFKEPGGAVLGVFQEKPGAGM